jgi:preprotein translocase subunit Sec63
VLLSIAFVLLIMTVTTNDAEVNPFDPFSILEIDLGASKKEIRNLTTP